MALILKSMRKHMGWEDAKDDYVILDGDRSVGRTTRNMAPDGFGLCPFPAPPPNNALARSLEEAKRQFKRRYEKMKAQGVRPFSG